MMSDYKFLDVEELSCNMNWLVGCALAWQLQKFQDLSKESMLGVLNSQVQENYGF